MTPAMIAVRRATDDADGNIDAPHAMRSVGRPVPIDGAAFPGVLERQAQCGGAMRSGGFVEHQVAAVVANGHMGPAAAAADDLDILGFIGGNLEGDRLIGVVAAPECKPSPFQVDPEQVAIKPFAPVDGSNLPLPPAGLFGLPLQLGLLFHGAQAGPLCALLPQHLLSGLIGLHGGNSFLLGHGLPAILRHAIDGGGAGGQQHDHH